MSHPISPEDISPIALAAMFRASPTKTMDLVMDLVCFNELWESMLRGHEAGSFKLAPHQADTFRAILAKHSPDAVARFDGVERKLMEQLGPTPMHRALKAIQQHNKTFLGLAAAGLGDLNELVDRQSLPPGTRILNVFAEMKSAKSIRISKGSALMLASLLSNAESSSEIPVILTNPVDPDAIALEITGGRGKVTTYNHIDLALKTELPVYFFKQALRDGRNEAEVRRAFSVGLDRMLDKFVAVENVEKQCLPGNFFELTSAVLKLAKEGVLPSQRSFSQMSGMRWQDSYRSEIFRKVEAPIGQILTGNIPGLLDMGSVPAAPTGLWVLLAQEKAWKVLQQAAEEGFDIHAPSPATQFTPLHLAAKAKSQEGICTLLMLGADPNAKDNSGHKPKDWYLKSTNANGAEFDAMVQSCNARLAVEAAMNAPTTAKAARAR